MIGEQVRDTWLTSLSANADFDRGWVEVAAAAWAVGTLGHPPRLVVDVGCGAGGATVAFGSHLPVAPDGPLRGSIGPILPGQPATEAAASPDRARGAGSGMVVAVDPDPRLIAVARGSIAAAGVGDRVQFGVAAIGGLPVPLGTADVVWASGVVHHVPDQQAAVCELAALLRPGGVLVLVEGGLPLRCLPHDVGIGRPGLEARLDEARARWFADLRAELGGPPMPYGWPQALANAGLTAIQTRSFVAESTPPLDEVGRSIAVKHLESARTELGDRLAPDDHATVARLLDPTDPAWIGRRYDLVVAAVRTVQLGQAPADPD